MSQESNKATIYVVGGFLVGALVTAGAFLMPGGGGQGNIRVQSSVPVQEYPVQEVPAEQIALKAMHIRWSEAEAIAKVMTKYNVTVPAELPAELKKLVTSEKVMSLEALRGLILNNSAVSSADVDNQLAYLRITGSKVDNVFASQKLPRVNSLPVEESKLLKTVISPSIIWIPVEDVFTVVDAMVAKGTLDVKAVNSIKAKAETSVREMEVLPMEEFAELAGINWPN